MSGDGFERTATLLVEGGPNVPRSADWARDEVEEERERARQLKVRPTEDH
jgi:hypothetical protein